MLIDKRKNRARRADPGLPDGDPILLRNDIRRQPVFYRIDLVLEFQLGLLETRNQELIGKRCRFQSPDLLIELAMLGTQSDEQLTQLAHLEARHARLTRMLESLTGSKEVSLRRAFQASANTRYRLEFIGLSLGQNAISMRPDQRGPHAVLLVVSNTRLDNLLRKCHHSLLFNRQTEGLMSPDAHLAALSEKHKALERRIVEEFQRPACDDAFIAKLKREKLKLKDEIDTLASQSKH